MQKIVRVEEIQSYAAAIDQAVIDYIRDGQIETYESFDTFDIVAFDWYDTQSPGSPPSQILIYLDKDDLFFICENEAALAAASQYFIPHPSNEYALFLFFRNLFRGSAKNLERIENQVANLEEDVSDGTEEGLRERISSSRSEIQVLKKYYEQLEFLFEEICDNDNGLISKKNLRYFEILRNRSVRLVAQVMNLREALTQVREAYQAEIGIEQSNLMRIFTMVTSIFMPLTLVVGWYGMNLKMPEFGWAYGYPFVVGLMAALCVGWYVLFKARGWFK